MPISLAQIHRPPGRQALVAVDRAIAELRRGAPVILGDGAAATVVLAAETAERDGLGRLFALCGGTSRAMNTALIAATTSEAKAITAPLFDLPAPQRGKITFTKSSEFPST